MTTLKFQKSPHSLQFQRPSSYGSETVHVKAQVSDRSAGNTFHSEDLGISYIRKFLQFDFMPHDDYIALVDWFDTVANGVSNEFSFTDEFGCVFVARFTETQLSFRRLNADHWNGGFVLECQHA